MSNNSCSNRFIFASACTTLVVGLVITAVKFYDKSASVGIKDVPVVCIAGVQYDVSVDSLTGKNYLTVQTNEDFELILCEGS